MQLSSKTLLPFAVAALATVSVTNANPAHAFTLTSADPPSGAITPANPLLALGNFSTLGANNITASFTGGSGNGIFGNTLTLLQGGAVTFNFSSVTGGPLAYFGISPLATFNANVVQGLQVSVNGVLIPFLNSAVPGDKFLSVSPSNAIEKITTLSITNGSSGLVSFDKYSYKVPTPALLPGLLGLGVAAWRKRKGEAAEKVGVDA